MHIFEKILDKSLMESFYKRNYGNALLMVNMSVRLTHLVKEKLDGPYWELIGNNRQHAYLSGSLQKGCVLETVSV
jgi:hypothetical protein